MYKQKNAFYLAVIGGGASGLVAAVFAAREAVKLNKNVIVSIYESNSRLGKKLLVTGNGRCNFTNENIELNNFYGENALATVVYKAFDNKAVINFFHEIGLLSRSDDAGRVYPTSYQASSVLDALRYEIKRLGIEEKTNTKITSIENVGSGFLLNGEFYADKCIIATGGKASPVHGSDGSGFLLSASLGVPLTRLYPALTSLVVENFTKGLKGIRAQGKIIVKCAGKVLAEDTGEIQYTEYGLSGIPSMQVSRFVSEALDCGKAPVFAVVDSCPFLSRERLLNELKGLISRNPALPGEMLLSGIMPKRLGISVLIERSVNPEKNIGIIHTAVLETIIKSVKGKKYKISSVKGFNDAQVTAGGISAAEINDKTLELKRVKGLYVCGEIINVDGACGGYNLQWAWSSGHMAGISAVREK